MTETPVALGRPLSAAEARQSPCLTCADTPCCTYMPVQRVSVSTLTELDWVGYVLGFEHMLVSLTSGGDWTVYYQQPCRHLSPVDGRCGVYGTPDKPSICTAYSDLSCWYRPALAVHVHADVLRLDHRRWSWLAERVTFDDARRIVSLPQWVDTVAAFDQLPITLDRPSRVDPADDTYDHWLEATRAGYEAAGDPTPYTLADPIVADPCTGCEAACCTTLSFAQQLPTTSAQVDHLRFVMGYPGVEVEITDSGWWVVIKTRCRHLIGNRCGIFGQPQRPLFCQSYEALACEYRVRFLHARPEGRLRLRLAHWGILAASTTFDAYGRVVAFPPVEQLRIFVERAERAAALAAAAPVDIAEPLVPTAI